MKITIAEQLRPFSHQPGCSCLIPTTTYQLEVFPALIRFYDLSGPQKKLVKEVTFQIEGPLKDFTVFQDLEKGCVSVVSRTHNYHVLPSLDIVTTKNPHLPPLDFKEKLSLGSHKKQEWEQISKRKDFREIFPLWFRLGSLLPSLPPLKSLEGVFSFLEEGNALLKQPATEKILPFFERFFLYAFEDLLVPRLEDRDFQGIALPKEGMPQETPLQLLTQGAALIRSLFFQQKEQNFYFLPHLPPSFFEGRFIDLKCNSYGELDLEWSKKMLRRVVFRSEKDALVNLHFPSFIKTYRLRLCEKEIGDVRRVDVPLEIKSGRLYLLDRFQK